MKGFFEVTEFRKSEGFQQFHLAATFQQSRLAQFCFKADGCFFHVKKEGCPPPHEIASDSTRWFSRRDLPWPALFGSYPQNPLSSGHVFTHHLQKRAQVNAELRWWTRFFSAKKASNRFFFRSPCILQASDWFTHHKQLNPIFSLPWKPTISFPNSTTPVPRSRRNKVWTTSTYLHASTGGSGGDPRPWWCGEESGWNLSAVFVKIRLKMRRRKFSKFSPQKNYVYIYQLTPK